MAKFVQGNFSADVEAVLQMGKAKFIATHSHIADADAVFDAIEKSAVKAEKKADKK